jgi:hypothetical protein
MTSWTTPRTWASETLTSTLLNTHLRDNLNHLSEQISRTGWTSFTPGLTNLTVGSGGTATGKYAYAGKTTFFYVEATLGASGFSVGVVSINFSETGVTYISQHPVADVALWDNSASTVYAGSAAWTSTTTMNVRALTVSGSNVIRSALSSTVPFTWAADDKILIHGFFERA